mmetsp:Transcript_27039/g.69312  ORF Transcript_27039/g.69312 Transcript_27039/m.69312 type:complete len:83 (+) Transcript_27039:1382-1630(+)
MRVIRLAHDLHTPEPADEKTCVCSGCWKGENAGQPWHIRQVALTARYIVDGTSPAPLQDTARPDKMEICTTCFLLYLVQTAM